MSPWYVPAAGAGYGEPQGLPVPLKSSQSLRRVRKLTEEDFTFSKNLAPVSRMNPNQLGHARGKGHELPMDQKPREAAWVLAVGACAPPEP